jgi:signal transduction histidine kinase/DNA-binding response OmpR family regulator
VTIVERLRRTSLGLKLGALGAVVTAGVVGLALVALSAQVHANTREVFTAQLSRNQRTIRELQRRDARELLVFASVIVQAPTFEAALGTVQLERNQGLTGGGAARTVVDELEKRVRQVDADLIIATDDSGRVLGSASQRGISVPSGASLRSLGAVAHALDPNTPADTGAMAVLRTDSGYVETAVYPIVQDGITRGALVLGRRIDNAFAVAQGAIADANVIVTAGSIPVASSDQRLIGANVPALLESHAGEASAIITLAGSDYVVAPVTLGETQDRVPVRLWMLQPLTQRVAALVEPLRRQFFVYGALAVIIAAFGAAFVARTVLSPFRRFVEYMRSGNAPEQREDRFDATNEAREVRTLNESFNQLMDSLANSQAQLRQSQKLEAIGTLAGGIAHDFNNLITVISGYTQLALMRTGRNSPEADDLRQVVDAADRAAKLTHQLLAFSRKQVLQPTVLDLADVVENVAPMLRRIIGEHIVLEIDSARPLSRVRADRGQLEQVILNLAVNARDAMPSGGSLTIATGNAPGDRCVLLTVRDTGTGMRSEVRERIFEPFFTTKELGKGTGLGLSMVHGIINQSGGSITVDSEPGKGTKFEIRLPAVEIVSSTEEEVSANDDLPGGTETVLIVEDAEDVRVLARRALEERGYTVLVASNADDALAIAAKRRVDVLLTDIVMPRTSGPQLVSRYPQSNPAPLVIYMSGYADDALSQYELDPNTVFLRKPFTPAVLLRTLRDALSAAGIVLLLSLMPRYGHAQGGIQLQGIADGEFWATSKTSNLLTRNAGRAATLGRLQVWGAYEPVRRFLVYAQGELETGSAAP